MPIKESAIAPAWLARMTIVSLFVSLFGLAMFSVVMLGTENVDILSILEASQGFPNVLDHIGILIQIFEKTTAWIPKAFSNIPNIPVVEFFTFVINALIKIIEICSYIVSLVPVLICMVILVPMWLAIDTLNILGAIVAALGGRTFNPIDLSPIYNLIGVH